MVEGEVVVVTVVVVVAEAVERVERGVMRCAELLRADHVH